MSRSPSLVKDKVFPFLVNQKKRLVMMYQELEHMILLLRLLKTILSRIKWEAARGKNSSQKKQHSFLDQEDMSLHKSLVMRELSTQLALKRNILMKL